MTNQRCCINQIQKKTLTLVELFYQHEGFKIYLLLKGAFTSKLLPLRNGLQNSDRKDIAKKHSERLSDGAWSHIKGVLSGSDSISRFEQRKVHLKLANMNAG
jgi:hypothetical protein